MTHDGIKTRRRLLAGGLAAALVAATGLPGQALGRRGGRITAGLTPEGLAIARAGATGVTLTEISGDGSLVGGFATGWESSEGGRVWEFDLRHENAGVFEVLGRFGVTSLRGSTAAVELAEPDGDLPLRLADPFLSVPGEPGLYRETAESHDAVTLTRTGPHWKEARAGWADDVTLIRIDLAAARLAALRQGRVDVIDGLDPHALRMLAARRDVTVTGDLAVSDRVTLPAAIGTLWPLDNGRMAERWWVG